MADPHATAEAVQLMRSFAERTGVSSSAPQRRYLWTDAFAVCNFVGLARTTGDGGWDELASKLIERVHYTLGRHRGDDGRTGWLSGLPEEEGAARPTAGGLRIGKSLPERAPHEPYDATLEWDRDGQYFHYLTRWMHALDVAARARRDVRLHQHARELARVAFERFTHGRRMYWKMSIDLSRPLVASMGHHDPLDGLISFLQIDETALALGEKPTLGDAIDWLSSIVAGQELATDDALGLGGLLSDAARVAQLGGHQPLLRQLLDAALEGLETFGRELNHPADMRLAFRELGLAIGLHAAGRLNEPLLEPYVPLDEAIVAFWRRPEHRRVDSWTEHQDINDVMLATALVPDGFVDLP